jgi:hypothetical protein
MPNIMNNMQEDAKNRHKEALNMIGALSDTTSSDGASSVCISLLLLHNPSMTCA